jgi:hypothetical protein
MICCSAAVFLALCCWLSLSHDTLDSVGHKYNISIHFQVEMSAFYALGEWRPHGAGSVGVVSEALQLPCCSSAWCVAAGRCRGSCRPSAGAGRMGGTCGTAPRMLCSWAWCAWVASGVPTTASLHVSMISVMGGVERYMSQQAAGAEGQARAPCALRCGWLQGGGAIHSCLITFRAVPAFLSAWHHHGHHFRELRRAGAMATTPGDGTGRSRAGYVCGEGCMCCLANTDVPGSQCAWFHYSYHRHCPG